jgi:RND family efflux transporter MFP subunit
MRILRTLLIGLIITGFNCRKGPKEAEDTAPEVKEKPPVAVEAIRVSKGVISRDILASGVAGGIHESYVVSETQGKIERVNFALGQWVKKGRTLVEVNSAIQYAAFEQAKRAAAAAKLNMDVTKKLFDEGNASEAELTNAQSQATGAIAQLESTQKAYEDCKIKAPISGFVAQKELTIEKGNVLAGGTLVARIVDISSLKATISVGEMEVGILKKGMPAKVKVQAVNSQIFKGKVAAIAAGSNPATGSYPVEVTWKNTPKREIKSGMSVRVTIMTKDSDSAILIPAMCIFEKEYKNAVYTAMDNKAAIRFVQTGRAVGNNIEVTEGLSEGDIVITSGIAGLSRGDKVKITIKEEAEVQNEHR